MSYSLKYSWQAAEDMLQVWDEVYEASAERSIADRYVVDLEQQIQKKKEFPFSAQKVFFGNLFTGFYMITFKAYRVFYRVREDKIEVARIIHYRRDFMRLLFMHKEQ